MIFLILASPFILLIIYSLIEPYILKVTKNEFFISKPGEANISNATNQFTFLHLTDLHLGRTRIKENKILNVIKSNNSDFLVFTGDYFEKYKQINLLINLIYEIRKFYKKPIYLCFGNHDRKDVFDNNPGSFEFTVQKLKEQNITILENASADFVKDNCRVRVIGLGDARSNNADVKQIITKNKSHNKYSINLLMTHNSDILMKMEPASVDFAVAGHTHGAQVRSPFNIETKLLHRKDILSSRHNILKGINRYNDIDFYITKGTGCSLFPVRFISHPEIASITLKTK